VGFLIGARHALLDGSGFANLRFEAAAGLVRSASTFMAASWRRNSVSWASSA
jgi:hypothetical protein